MPTINDNAWEKFISVKGIELDGKSYQIRASELKKISGREPRLLAKFDNPSQLPRIFRENSYRIIPINNGTYLIFKGELFGTLEQCFEKQTLRATNEFPFATVGRGTGESEYLDNAFNSGLLTDFTNSSKLYMTIRGRERSRSFEFKVNPNSPLIRIDGVQIETDAGYESESEVVIVEAKIGNQTDFNIRQLYFPFRHFGLVAPQKIIRPLFFEYDLPNATYTLREFIFKDKFILDSLQQVRCCVYSLVDRVAYKIDELIDPNFQTASNIAPQADDLNKVLELLTQINAGENSVGDLADYFVFDKRQSNYYGEAAEYLGLITRNRGFFELTNRAVEFISLPVGSQRMYIAKLIVNSPLFRAAIKTGYRKGFFTIGDIETIIASVQNNKSTNRYTKSTISRRRSTITNWLKWLSKEMGCFRIEDDRYFLV